MKIYEDALKGFEEASKIDQVTLQPYNNMGKEYVQEMGNLAEAGKNYQKKLLK
ncbi:MAG: hypothetical protein MZU97_02135 [Bacillus subtilis]|nr:hypothetical protein [Bacillus subtilis]